MKKILAVLLALSAFAPFVFGQDDEVRPAAIGVSFFLNDFQTASKIRTSSLSQVLSNKAWTKPKEMSPGIAITYFQGLRKHIDFALVIFRTNADPFDVCIEMADVQMRIIHRIFYRLLFLIIKTKLIIHQI